MNKAFALEVLTEVQGTSPSYVREYGISIVREAYGYISRLNQKRKKKDTQTIYLLDKIKELL